MSRQHLTSFNLTPTQILVLCAIRHLEPTTYRAIGALLHRERYWLHTYLEGRYKLFGTFVDKGPALKNSTIRLTETGREAIKDMALIIEGWETRVGQVELK